MFLVLHNKTQQNNHNTKGFTGEGELTYQIAEPGMPITKHFPIKISTEVAESTVELS